MSSEDIQKTIVRFLKDFNPVRVALFGSFVREESTNSNDIDILIDFQESYSLLQLIQIENELSDKLGIKVDLVTEGSLKNERIKKSIQKDLRIIYEA